MMSRVACDFSPASGSGVSTCTAGLPAWPCRWADTFVQPCAIAVVNPDSKGGHGGREQIACQKHYDPVQPDMIDLTHRGNVTVLRMAHGKANALDLKLCEALTSKLDECQRSPSIGPLVLTGTGRMFSAGVGLPRVGDG